MQPATKAPVFTGTGSLPALPAGKSYRPLAEHLHRRRTRTLEDALATAPTSGGSRLSRRAAREASVPVMHRLLNRATLGPSRQDFDQIQQIGYEPWLERQLDYESLDTSDLEAAIREHLPSVSMEPFELVLIYGGDDQFRPAFDLITATTYRAIFSPRQLYERMVVFWTDHFNIDITADFQTFLKPTDDRDVIRKHALGKFPDLLRASAHSPAMLVYLTNDSNEKGHPNENYARELMELHTLGTDRGYTQEDVREVARAFTGWTAWGRDGGRRLGTFRFDPETHDAEPKLVLGQQLPGGRGIEDGEDVLRILALHPNTASFVAEKLLRYLWGYEPPQERIDAVAERYLETGGDIRDMLRLILSPKWMAAATDKLKRPFHLVASAQRALFAEAAEPRFLLFSLFSTGHLPFFWHPPNGYPDSAEYWSGLLLPRWNFADLAPKVEIERLVEILEPLLVTDDPAAIVDLFAWLLLDGRLAEAERQAVVDFLTAAPFEGIRVVEALSLVLDSPSFQSY